MSLLQLSNYREAELLKRKKDRNVVESREQTDIQRVTYKGASLLH